MADIEHYRFESERRVVDDSWSTEDADNTKNVDGDDGRRSNAVEDGERVGNTEWCSCGTCAIKPTSKECLCWQEMDQLD